MASAQLTDILTERWPLLAVGATTLVGATLFRHLYKWSVISAIPLVGSEIGDREKRRMAYIMGGKRLYEEGYRKVERFPRHVTSTDPEPSTLRSPSPVSQHLILPKKALHSNVPITSFYLVQRRHFSSYNRQRMVHHHRVAKVSWGASKAP